MDSRNERRVAEPSTGIATNFIVSFATVLALLGPSGCGDDGDGGRPRISALREVDLVSNQPGAATTDPLLLNAWGIALGATGAVWVSDNHAGVSTVYSGSGQPISPMQITIPSPPGSTDPAAPTGVVFNGTADFEGDKFIFATEDGTIAGWQAGASAVLRADNSGADAIYKGIALARTPSGSLLYLANFHEGRVEVLDHTYHPITLAPGAFTDPQLPDGFAPFNIGYINGKVYVTYAKQGDTKEDDEKGAGRGYIDIFDNDGVFQRRFASQGPLNSPWALALVPADFGGIGGDLLVGNFGDGRINIFSVDSGAFIGQLLRPDHSPLAIDGLWALVFGPPLSAGGSSTLYFAAGPEEEANGLFGRLDPVS